MWDRGKYNSRARITISCHNNHAWANIPTDPPNVKEVRLVDDIAERSLDGVNIKQQKIREILVAFSARKISPTTRLWLCGNSIMGSDGSLWRSRRTSRAIDKAFEEGTGYDFTASIPEHLELEYHQVTHSFWGSIGI